MLPLYTTQISRLRATGFSLVRLDFDAAGAFFFSLVASAAGVASRVAASACRRSSIRLVVLRAISIRALQKNQFVRHTPSGSAARIGKYTVNHARPASA